MRRETKMADVKRRDDLVMGPKEKALAALNAGNIDETLKQIDALHKQFKPLHDRYCEWINYLLTFIAERVGEEAVEEAMEGTFKAVYGKMFASAVPFTPRSWKKRWRVLIKPSPPTTPRCGWG
jgi:hypothetical protein